VDLDSEYSVEVDTEAEGETPARWYAVQDRVRRQLAYAEQDIVGPVGDLPVREGVPGERAGQRD